MPHFSFARLDAARTRLADVALAFVGGQGKSGTTWVERLIDAHPEAACLGEGHFAEGLGRRLYAALADYNREIAANNARFPELEDFPTLADADAAELARAALLLQFDRIARRQPEARAVAVRTPSELSRIAELAELFPQARFVHALRDPRDVAVSLWWHRERLEPGRVAREFGSIEQLARHLVPRWTDQVLRTRETARAAGVALHEVVYERLQTDPDAAADALFGFLGLSTAPAHRQAALAATRFEHLSGGRRPGETAADSHFRSGTSGQWREHMAAVPPGGWPPQTAALFEALGYPLI